MRRNLVTCDWCKNEIRNPYFLDVGITPWCPSQKHQFCNRLCLYEFLVKDKEICAKRETTINDPNDSLTNQWKKKQ